MKTKPSMMSAGIVATAISCAALGGEFEITRSTIDGGGGFSAGGAFELEGTIGQPDAGPGASGMTGGAYELVGGFWPGATLSMILGDCDGDGDVDLDDYLELETCLFGPDVAFGAACECFDFDEDGDVDLADFHQIQAAFTGP